MPHLFDLSSSNHAYSWLLVFSLSSASKSRVPRLNGKKRGIFATRSPHRVNPIGLSVARLERVDQKGGKLYLTGLDLVDYTPVLDIKPYHPADVIGPDILGLPQWMVDTPQQLLSVQFTERSLQQLNEFSSKLRFKKVDV